MENETSITAGTEALNKALVIRPRPFCGGEAERILRGNAHTKKRSAEIKCKECNVLMVVGAIRNDLDWCAAIVTGKWNRRAEGKGHGV